MSFISEIQPQGDLHIDLSYQPTFHSWYQSLHIHTFHKSFRFIEYLPFIDKAAFNFLKIDKFGG